MHPSDRLFEAVYAGDLSAANDAVAGGADVNYQDEDEGTPLESACHLGRLDIVRFLVEQGADPNHWARGDNPLRSAARGGRRDVYEYLLRIVSDEVHNSANENDLKQGELRREREADPNVDAFIRDAAQGRLAEVRSALAVGANPNAFNSCGCTALHYAAYYGQMSVVEVLLAAGADVDWRSEESGALGECATALGISAGSDYVSDHGPLIRTLVAAGADPNAQDLNGQTPLMHAVDKGFFGYPDAVAALLEAGASLDVKDSDGRTARDIAALRKHSGEILAMLESDHASS